MLATVESLCSMDCMKAEKMFLLGDTIYVQTVDSYHLLHAIDRTTFSIEEVSMHYHDIAWHDLYVTAAIQVYNGVAYKWTAAGLAAGTREPDGVHWRIIETTGPMPHNDNFLSAGVQDDGTAKYIILMREASENRPDSMEFFVHELNLGTKQWKRSIVTDFKILDNIESEFSDAMLYLVATPTKLHVFSKSGSADSVMIDRSTNICSPNKFNSKVLNASFGPSFVLQDKLHSLVFEKQEDECLLNLYRFDEAKHEWRRIGKRQCLAEFDARCSEIVVAGSRAYILTNTNSVAFAGKLMFMFVIDLRLCGEESVSSFRVLSRHADRRGNPSLFDWALTAIRRCDAVWQQAASILPQALLTQACRRVSAGDAVSAWPGFQKDQVHFNDQYSYWDEYGHYMNWDENDRKRAQPEPVTFEGLHSLRTANKQYLRAWQGPSGHRDLYVDLAPHCRSCEKWSIEPLQGGKVILKSIHKWYLSAHRNGRVGFSETAGATEQWEPVQNDDGSWSLKSAHGAWLSYFQGDGIICTMPRNGKTEQFWLGSW